MGKGAAGPGVGLQLGARAELQLRPGVLQSLRLLPLGSDALRETVEQALIDNPMLERSPGTTCPGCGRHHRSSTCPRCPSVLRYAVQDPAVTPFDNLEAAAACEIRSDCRSALPVLIAHLTGRGLLDAEPDRIAAAHDLPADVVVEAVRAIKAAGPVGVAETSVRDLLVAQAHELVATGVAAPWIVELVRNDLEAVAANDVDTVAQKLCISPAEVGEAFCLVRERLRPVAVVEIPEGPEFTAFPDVFVYRAADGHVEVEVPDSGWFGLALAEVQPAVLADAYASAWLAGHEREARELLRQVDTRASVLRRVATYLVDRQAGYFDGGPAAHVPLTRTDVARALGLHPSTVSRCVRGKTMRRPDGRIAALADLLGGAVAIKARIAELAAAGRVSDARLCRALADSGYVVARRTVAKYRAELGIEAGGLRRS
ncbi:helix-turn-helix domain-containing protein [Kribbella sp. CA-247076]|uniref:RNA polymerase factor sigma-54 n=1 Tax=Kribbella sp. CA-247076 TaxID=3239941 RepID=UPI003D8F0E4A